MNPRLLLEKSILVGALLFASCVLAQDFALQDERLNACVSKLAKKKNWQSADAVTEIVCHNKKINSAAGIEQFRNLTKLSLYKNRLTSVDFSPFGSLEHINLAGNQLASLTLTDHPNLKLLYVFHNPITELSVTNALELTTLKANNGQLTSVTLNNTPALTKLYLFDNQLEIIDIEPLTLLRYLDVRHNPMPDDFYDFLDARPDLTSLHDGNAEDWQ